MTSETFPYLEDNRQDEQRTRLNCLTGAQNVDLLQYQETTENPLKYRKYGSRLGGVKVRHKRQVLQDMARPLKHWLYKHRDNPYPTKTEKVLLALGSHMTLVQVSNWFANARRRLKNTVRQPDLSWALRIKLYNKYIQGNAERLSVCSDDADSDDNDCPFQTPICSSDMGKKTGGVLTMATGDDSASPPPKYKSSLLNRYLNDTLRHMMAGQADGVALMRRNHSESFSSNECDRDVVSPASSYETETNFIYRMETLDYTSCRSDSGQHQERGQQSPKKQDWREINAAVALTSLAQGQSCRADIKTPPGAAAGLSCSVSRTTGVGHRTPAAAPGRSSTLTSRIIQRSSHISEVQTIKVACGNQT
ncbi:homeobox protein Mohawk-like [Entelurus aequoreus]|uniref:homeobox protein Mohawk-like n=1 Tax=Entelurus aequoreus TaxID=161455 RepID=UPI002B1E1FFB|nr:homeobox protein Mohawk-like [Entelurus aequoreus]XP_061924799.1 homeobox protein Mohawk-like [Entelurus aequoreus]